VPETIIRAITFLLLRNAGANGSWLFIAIGIVVVLYLTKHDRRLPGTRLPTPRPILYAIDDVGEAYDVRWFCSGVCRDAALDRYPNAAAFTFGEDINHIHGLLCEHCDRTLDDMETTG
jgi:hypothetical protein